MANGGIIGPVNQTSFGKCTVTTKTSSGPLTTQPGTRIVKTLIVAGGGAGGNDAGGGGGAGGLRNLELNAQGAIAVTVGGGSANPGSPQSSAGRGTDSTVIACGTTYTATGGGGGVFDTSSACANSGGSGGGRKNAAAGAGNVGGFIPPEGFPGGDTPGQSNGG